MSGRRAPAAPWPADRSLPVIHPLSLADVRGGAGGNGWPLDDVVSLKLSGEEAERGSMSFEPTIEAAEYPYTFAADDGSITINFGLLTGREATQAEIDRLARLLFYETNVGPDITIISRRRQDYGAGIETITHQVHVSVSRDHSPEVERHCRIWVLDCADDRRVAPLDRFAD